MDRRRLVLLTLLLVVCLINTHAQEEQINNDDNAVKEKTPIEENIDTPLDQNEHLNPDETTEVKAESKIDERAGEILSEKQSTLSEEIDNNKDPVGPETPPENLEKQPENRESEESIPEENDADFVVDQPAIISKLLVVKDNISGHKHSSFSEDKSSNRGDEKTTVQVKEEAEKRIEEKEKEKQMADADEQGAEDTEERPEDSEEYVPPDSETTPPTENSVEENLNTGDDPVDDSAPKESNNVDTGKNLDATEEQDSLNSVEESVQDTRNVDDQNEQDAPNSAEHGKEASNSDEKMGEDTASPDSTGEQPSTQDSTTENNVPEEHDKEAQGSKETSAEQADIEDDDIMKEDKLYRANSGLPSENEEKEPKTESKVGKEREAANEAKKSDESAKEAVETKSDTATKRVRKEPEKKIQPGAALFDEAMDLLKAGKKDVRKAYRLLAEAAFMNNTDAAEKIAYPYLFGDNIKRNRTKAIQLFHIMADRGIPLGQQGLGFVYGAGLSVNSSQAKALIYTTFGALGGNAMAHMMLGYRYFNGIGVAKSCESALTHYKKVAKKVTDETTSHGGNAVQRVRLYDELEQPGGTSAQIDEDLLQYYQFLADKGDLQAQVGLGQLYFQGGRGIDVNYEKAFKYFQLAGDVENGNGLAYLGKMYLDGLHVEKDQKKAFDYFTKAAAQSNPIGQAGLGMIYLKGAGVPKDYDQAMKYFSQAAEQGWVEGQLQLGNMYYNGIGVKKDYRQAVKYFTFASQSGHVMAFYNLASMHATGAGVMRSCNTAAELFKNVAERGKWSMMFMDAYDSYRAGDLKTALLKYYYLAELGYEVAQSNVAYVLEKGEMAWFSQNETYARALLQWSRAASQGYAVARVKVGDYHFYGYGTKVDYDTSALHYRMASDQQNNPQAMFNLGYMHERGFGLKEDIHLAKRFYDMAAEASPDAHFPVTLALLKLSMHFMCEWLQNNYKFWEFAPVERMKLFVLQKLGPDWDMYLITLLAVVLGGLLLFRRTLRR